MDKNNVAVISTVQEYISQIDRLNKIEKKGGAGVSDFIKSVRYLKEDKEVTLWFRGQSEMTWDLSPSLYRKIKNEKNIRNPWNQIQKVEKSWYEEFGARNYHLLDRLPENYFMWLIQMQHYGAATRLLDWSEEALTGLFFAVENQFMGNSYSALPCVWVLKPYRLMHYSLKKPNNRRLLQTKGHSVYMLKSLLNVSETDDVMKSIYNTEPMPVLAPYNNSRIAAQSGVFTIFPNRNRKADLSQFSLNKLRDASEYLFQIIILCPDEISKQLKRLGFKRSMFYPEIPNVSQELEEKFLRTIYNPDR